MKISAAIVSPSCRPRYDNPPRLSGESVLVIGDSQAPFHDAGFINHIREVAFAWGIKKCIWAGDMADLATFSIFMNDSEDAEQELDETHLALAELASGFDEVTWLTGNHESRFRLALNRYLSLERVRMILGLSTHIHTSDYYYCWVGTDWKVTHPRNTSEIAARVATWLAEKYDCNIAMLHNHLTGIGITRDGKHLGIDVGMCADPKRLDYVALRDNKRPAMQQGALILYWDGDDYHPRLLNPLLTDWDFEIWSARHYQVPPRNLRGWE